MVFIQKILKYGIWKVNHDQIIQLNEKIVRMLKTGLEYDTFRVHSQDLLESKTYVMFIASIVRNYLFRGLKKVSQNENDLKNYTVPTAISELEKSQ